MMGARRLLESLFATRLELGRGEEHTRRARAHHHYFMPVTDKSLRRLLG